MHEHPLARNLLLASRRSTARVFAMPIVLLALFAIESSTPALPRSHVVQAQQAISPPVQPSSGPGGREYRFDRVTTARAGDSPRGAWLYAPDEASASDRETLPVVVFLHGFGATDPVTYQEWIDHIVRRGSLVIYPDYQEEGMPARDQGAYLTNMFSGIEAAIALLGVSPDRVHVVGHSLGAVLTAAYGALAPATNLPQAATLTMIEPGGCRNCGSVGGFGVPLPLDLRIPSDTLVRTVVGADDSLVGAADARVIQRMLGEVPADRNTFETIRSDDHGSPALSADHLFPQTGRFGGETDALDWFGLWRPFDALMNCADRDQECDIALGATDAHRFMGFWSDGTPVLPPEPVA